MKRVLLTILVCCFIQQGHAQTDKYEFPKQSDLRLANLKTYEELRNAHQLPNKVLSSLSTAGLVETFLDYPLLYELMAYNTPQQGFDKMRSNFNGLDELLRRKDAGAALISTYASMNPAAISPDWTLVQTGNFSLKIYAMEVLLAQQEIISVLGMKEKEQLLELAFAKFETKRANDQVYKSFTQGGSAWVMLRLMNTDSRKYSVDQLADNDGRFNALKEFGLADDLTNERIYNHMKRVLKK